MNAFREIISRQLEQITKYELSIMKLKNRIIEQ